jgi:hypothetical protein
MNRPILHAALPRSLAPLAGALLPVLLWTGAAGAQSTPPPPAPAAAAQAAPAPLPAAQRLRITLVHDDEPSRATRDQLLRLAAAYPLERWLFTTEVRIEGGVIPHSHPVLTLSTRHVKDDELLLATFVHEQLHWWISSRREGTEKAIAELRRLFPTVPVGYPEGGEDERSSYSHLLLCALERQALRELVGELRADQVIDFWTRDHYTWIYKTVRERGFEIGKILRAQGLQP